MSQELVLTKERNKLKRSKNDLKPKINNKTKNNQYKNLIYLSKIFVLDFRTQVGGLDSVHDNIKQKARPVTQALKLDAFIQSTP